MAKGILKVAALFVLFIIIFELQRIAFICCNLSIVGEHDFADYFCALLAGLPLDASMAGYFSLGLLVLSVIRVWSDTKALRIIERSYLLLISVVVAIISVLDITLYGYWGFRLDATPLFYFTSSPEAAIAGGNTVQLVAGPLAIIALAYGITWALWRIADLRILAQSMLGKRSRIYALLLHLLVAGLLFVAIRGGVTVSTMNVSRAYFSEDRTLNHIAINPEFSLLYSLTHQCNFGEQFQYLSEEEAANEFAMLHQKSEVKTDSLLLCPTPDIYLIIAESFSTHLLPSMGGEPVALRLDSIAKEGVVFTNFYANSFRTDRALPAILSGFPAQPTTSVMKYVEKAEHLPSIARALQANGYEASYYYGGDINFTNMLAYVKNQGYTKVVCDSDFPLSQRMSKWGAPDHMLFQRAWADVCERSSLAPQFYVIQTSSSHEPFEVPFHKSIYPGEPERQLRANAFEYTDSCIGEFVKHLRQSDHWTSSLVIIVPDHYGAYPQISDTEQRHRVPLILTGGALNMSRQRVATIGSQIDIAATLLAMLNIDFTQFTFSKNLFDPNIPHFAFFTEPEVMGFISDYATVIYNLDADHIEASKGDSSQALRQSKAYLQTVYTLLDQL